jgi:hypothetical protein
VAFPRAPLQRARALQATSPHTPAAKQADEASQQHERVAQRGPRGRHPEAAFAPQADDEPDLRERLEDFRRKQAKYLQQHIAFLSANLDPFGQLLRARAHLMFRALVAYLRMRKREEVRRSRTPLHRR